MLNDEKKTWAYKTKRKTSKFEQISITRVNLPNLQPVKS